MTGKYQTGDEPVPGYRLSEFLGRGGFGEVWKVIAPGGAEAALKIINLSGKQGLKEFQALRLVKRIRHPNLAPLFAYWLKDASDQLLQDADASLDDLKQAVSGVGPLDGTMIAMPKSTTTRPVELIIAMGLGEKDLFRRLDECRQQGLPGIPTPELLGYMEDTARAIDYLNSPRHMLGTGLGAVQHCDIKPHNIMIVGGATQLCDFGLARMLGDVRKTATAAGTIAYVAPECLTQNEPSSSTDQYSLAVTYVELKTGRLPYSSDNYSDVLNAVLKGALDLSDLPAAERSVVQRATSLEPGQRYPTTVEMVHALRDAVESGQMAKAAAAPARPRRGRAASLVGLLLLTSIVVAGAWGFWAWRQQESARLISRVDPLDRPVKLHLDETPKDAPDLEAKANRAEEIRLAAEQEAKARHDKEMEDAAAREAQALRAKEMDDAAEQLAQTLLAEGNRLLDKGEFITAADLFDKVILEAPRHAQEARLQRGVCFLETQNYDAAEIELSHAIELNAEDARAFSRRATTRLRQNKLDDAIADFTKAIKIEPDARDYIGRSVARLAQGNQDLAIDDATAALQRDPNSAAAYFNRGLAYLDQQKSQQAIDDFTETLRHDPDNPADVHLSRAAAAELSGDDQLAKLDGSIAHDLQILEQDPNEVETAARLAWLLATASDARARDGHKAVELATSACKLSHWKTAAYLDTLAAAYAEDGQFEPAVKWSTQAVELTADVLQRSQFQSRLKLYESHQPYRQPALKAKP